MFWFLTYSVLRIRLSSKLAKMTFLGPETMKNNTKISQSIRGMCAIMAVYV